MSLMLYIDFRLTGLLIHCVDLKLKPKGYTFKLLQLSNPEHQGPKLKAQSGIADIRVENLRGVA